MHVATLTGQVEFEWLDQERSRKVRFLLLYRIDPEFEPDILAVKSTASLVFRDDGSAGEWSNYVPSGCLADFLDELERDELLVERLNIECRRAAGVSE